MFHSSLLTTVKVVVVVISDLHVNHERVKCQVANYGFLQSFQSTRRAPNMPIINILIQVTLKREFRSLGTLG